MSSSLSSSKDGKPSFNLQKALDKCVSDWDKAKAARDKAEADLALVSHSQPKDVKPISNTTTTNDMSSSLSSSKDGKPSFNLQKALDKCVSDWDKAKAARDKAEADLALVSHSQPKDVKPISNTTTTNDMLSSLSSSKDGKSLFSLQKSLDKTVSDWDKAQAAKMKFPTALVTPTRQKDAKPMYPKPPSRQN